MMTTLAWVGGFFVAFWLLVITWFAICWCWELVHRRVRMRRAIREVVQPAPRWGRV